MYTRTTTVLNKTGLHLRPAAEFVALAGRSVSEITIKRADTTEEALNAKSIVLLLSMAIAKGTRVEIAAQGEDEKQAVDGLIELIETGFGDL